MSHPHQNPQTFLERVGDRAEFDRQVTEVFQSMRSDLDCAPHPRWRWDDTAVGRFNPLAVPDQMIQSAIDNGATEDQCWGIVTLMAHRIERRFPKPVMTVEAASQAETEAESDANPIQHRAAVDPNCESVLVDAERKLTRQVRVLDALIAALRNRIDIIRGKRAPRTITVGR